MNRRRRTRLICRWAGVAILAVWGLSFVWGVSVVLPARFQTFFEAFSLSDGLINIWVDFDYLLSPEVRFFRIGSPSHWGIHTYLFGSLSAPNSWPGRQLILPATAPLGLSAALIGFSYWRRHPKGHCPKCGYDLTGIADKCPECGCAVKAVKAVKP